MKLGGIIHGSLESPIDYVRTVFKTDDLPLSSDSLRLNAQYFSMDENTQSGATMATTIKSFVSASVDWLGDSVAGQASSSAQSQVNSQYSRHSIAGTLVISLSCTHKEACILAPLVLDLDKAIGVWNEMFPGKSLNNTDKLKMYTAAKKQGGPADKEKMTIISGATYGSSFVAMVHILNTKQTTSSEVMMSMAESMEAQFKVGGFIAQYSGGFGVDSSFSADIKNLLSSQNIQSHCTITTMGSIPSITSADVKMGVKEFSNFDGASSMKQLATLQNATASDKDSVESAATAARTGKQMLEMKAAQVKSTLAALGDIDDKSNKVLDVNSVMKAMEDYVNKALAGNLGVPVNFYLKNISRSDLAQAWLKKYFPNWGPSGRTTTNGSEAPATNSDNG